MIKKAIVVLLCTIPAIGFCRASDKTAFCRDLLDEYRQGNFLRAADRCETYYQKQQKSPESNLDELYKDETAKKAVLLHFIFKHVVKTGGHPVRDPEFFQWLLQKPDILEEITRFGAATNGSWGALNEIWKKENKSLDGTNLSMAIGAAFAASDFDKTRCVEKYFFYKKAFLENKLQPGFENLSPREFALLFKSRFSCEDLAWAQNYLTVKKLLNINENYGNKLCRQIPYRKFNAKGVSIHRGAAFYDNKPVTLPLFLEYGGVCGAVSTAGTGLLHARGIPAFTIGQPGHCALVWKSPSGNWKIANDIFGPAWSSGTNNTICPWQGTPALLTRYAEFLKKKESGLSDFYLTAAAATKSKNAKIFYLKNAIRVCPENFGAYSSLSELIRSDVEKEAVADEIVRVFKNDPIILEQLLPKFHDFKSSKTRKRSRQLSGSLLSSETPRISHDIYMRNSLELITEDIPELEGKATFNVQNKHKFFKELFEIIKESKNKNSISLKLILFIENNFCFLKNNSHACAAFLSLYCELYLLRGEKEIPQAIRFLNNELNMLSGKTDKTAGEIAAEITEAKTKLENSLSNRI